MHALPTGAHVFAEQDVVEGGGADQVELLPDHLLDELWLHTVLAHGDVEEAQLLEDGGDGESLRVLADAVGTLPEASGLHAGEALEAFMLQHTRHWAQKQQLSHVRVNTT